jgi:hypothetical protein
VQYANNKLIITRNPFGFSNVTSTARGGNNKKTRSTKTLVYKNKTRLKKGGVGAEMMNYQGVSKNPDYMTNPEFIKTVIKVMEQNGLILKPFEDAKKDILLPKLEKALYDNSDKFQETFIKESGDALENVNVLKNRILGLTSYFRSAQEKLLPNIIPDETGNEYHLVKVPMSDYQFSKYAVIRKEEYEKEDRAAKRRRMAQNNAANELFNTASSYRIFSRTSCNFVFPDSIERPRPPSKFAKSGEETEAEKKARLEAEAKKNKIDPEKLAQGITAGATALGSVVGTVQAFKGDGTKAPSRRKSLKDACGRKPLFGKEKKGYNDCVKEYNAGKIGGVNTKAPESSSNETPPETPPETNNTTRNIIIGVVVVGVLVTAFIGYKKGWFGKKAG